MFTQAWFMKLQYLFIYILDSTSVSASSQANEQATSHSYNNKSFLHHNSAMSQSDLMNTLKEQIMTYILRHNRKRSGSSSFQSSNDDEGTGLPSETKKRESLQQKSEFSNTEVMDLLRLDKKTTMDLLTTTDKSLRHTKKRVDSSSSESIPNDVRYGILSALKDNEYLHRISELYNLNLLNLLKNSTMTSITTRHTKKRSSYSSSESSSEGENTGLLSAWKDYDSLSPNFRLSKRVSMIPRASMMPFWIHLINILRNKMMAHTSFRHTKKRAEFPTFLQNLPRL